MAVLFQRRLLLWPEGAVIRPAATARFQPQEAAPEEVPAGRVVPGYFSKSAIVFNSPATYSRLPSSSICSLACRACLRYDCLLSASPATACVPDGSLRLAKPGVDTGNLPHTSVSPPILLATVPEYVPFLPVGLPASCWGARFLGLGAVSSGVEGQGSLGGRRPGVSVRPVSSDASTVGSVGPGSRRHS